MAQSGDLFLLDMGDPIRIIDLAERLIRLSGKSSNKVKMGKSRQHRTVAGCPGESYTKSFGGVSAQPTAHPKIMRLASSTKHEKRLSREPKGSLSTLVSLTSRSLKTLRRIVGYTAPQSFKDVKRLIHPVLHLVFLVTRP